MDTVIDDAVDKYKSKPNKKVLTTVGLGSLALLAGGFVLASSNDAVPLPAYVPGEMIVSFEEDLTPDDMERLDTLLDGEMYEPLFPAGHELDNMYVIHVDEDEDVEALSGMFASAAGVKYAEPNYIDTLPFEVTEGSLSIADVLEGKVPNDPFFHSRGSWGQEYADMWGLHTIRSVQAWELSTGSEDIIVAVIDTGIDYNHPELEGRVLKGWDFVNNDDDAMDDHSHGTHVAGTIGANTNNKTGVAAINWNVKFLPLKVCTASGGCPRSGTLQAIAYAGDHDANVINMSLGGMGSPSSYDEAIRYADSKGVFIVAAAGNSSADTCNFVPAAHPLVFAVAATDPDDNRATFSNWGKCTDIGAPGVGILSSISEINVVPPRYPIVAEQYAAFNGTSMASPHMAGVTALVLATNPELIGNREAITELLRESVDEVETDKYIGTGRTNLFKAITNALNWEE